MNEDKRKKISRYALYGLYFAVCAALPLLVGMLPRKYGVEWIVGWPTFLSNLLVWSPVIAVFTHTLLKLLKQPLDEKFTKKKKKLSVLFFGLLCAFYIGMCIVMSFSIQWRKVDRYERSPSGKNKAVVMVEKAKYGRTESIHPVRGLFFFEDDNRVYMNPDFEDITLTWLDDNTLEITRTREYDGEISTETEQLQW